MKQTHATLSSTADLAEIASAFAALGSEQRLTVLTTLVRAGPDGLSIGVLGTRCGITGSTLTHHLKILSSSGLIRQARQGRAVICAAAAYDRVGDLSRYLLSECCADQPAPRRDHAHD
jgi:DNA-binding transcriptional ArsR family regulator